MLIEGGPRVLPHNHKTIKHYNLKIISDLHMVLLLQLRITLLRFRTYDNKTLLILKIPFATIIQSGTNGVGGIRGYGRCAEGPVFVLCESMVCFKYYRPTRHYIRLFLRQAAASPT